MAGFSESQVASLESPLARETVKQRTQANRKFSYIEGWHAIAEANRIFGFDAWDRELVEIKCVAERERKIGSDRQREGHQVSYLARVRVTVRAGDMTIRREGVGYGSGIDADLGAAHESAAKEAETDAMKRALVTFGNPFGLALYDKDQAEVSPAAAPQAPATAAPRRGQESRAPATPAKPNGTAPHSDHPRRAKALKAYQHMSWELDRITTTQQASALLKKHGDKIFPDLDLLAQVNPEGQAALKKRFAEFGIDVDAERARIASQERMMGADEAEHALQ